MEDNQKNYRNCLMYLKFIGICTYMYMCVPTNECNASVNFSTCLRYISQGQATLKLIILLRQLTHYWNYKHVTTYWIRAIFKFTSIKSIIGRSFNLSICVVAIYVCAVCAHVCGCMPLCTCQGQKAKLGTLFYHAPPFSLPGSGARLMAHESLEPCPCPPALLILQPCLAFQECVVD